MSNGFEINISEVDFKAKPTTEQNWILFQGVTSIRQCVNDIDMEGCEYARKRNRYWTLKILTAISGGATFAIGIVYIVFKLLNGG